MPAYAPGSPAPARVLDPIAGSYPDILLRATDLPVDVPGTIHAWTGDSATSFFFQ
jgi:hypothetical protein